MRDPGHPDYAFHQEGPSTSRKGSCLGGKQRMLRSAVPTYRK